jgi:hypothetical protein
MGKVRSAVIPSVLNLPIWPTFFVSHCLASRAISDREVIHPLNPQD